MRRRRVAAGVPHDWPPVLRYVVRAAELECPRGHAEALVALTTLALRKVPARGLFDPAVRGEDDLFAAIESVARSYLELSNARTAWGAALDAAGLPLSGRDEIEQAALQVQTVSDTAHFYAGLAFGLASVSIYRPI